MIACSVSLTGHQESNHAALETKLQSFLLDIFVSVSRLQLLWGMQAAKWVYCPAWPSHREVIIIAITITMILTPSLSRSPESNISLGNPDGDIATARRQFVGFCQTDAVTVKPTCDGQLVKLMNVKLATIQRLALHKDLLKHFYIQSSPPAGSLSTWISNWIESVWNSQAVADKDLKSLAKDSGLVII